MLITNTFMALAVVVIIGISGLVFLYVENHKPVYYVEEKKHTSDDNHECAK